MSDKKYRVIYADPPWQIGAFPQEWRRDVRSSEPGGDRVKPVPYPTMTLEEICALPVQDLALPDSVLMLWTINAYLEQSYSVARAWGFRPSKMLVWAKAPMGTCMGGVFASNTEFLLYATRGRVGAIGRHESSWFQAKRGRHSQKPMIIREIIDRCFEGPKIELFAREAFLGWDAWGNEIKSDIELTA